MKIINPHEGAASLEVHAEDGRLLLAIHQDGTVTGEVEDANEAGARFVAYVRGQFAPTATREVNDALGFIDQTVYANEDSSPTVRWPNREVLELLGMIRDKLTNHESESDRA